MSSDEKADAEPYDKIHGTTADKAEPDIDPDPARANDRSTGGVPEPGAPDEAATTSPTPTPKFVGRVAGDDVGYAEETGAERRAEVDDER